MFGNFLGWFKYVLVIFVLLVSINNMIYAEELSPEGKILFVYADNIGETSYFISDILSNDNMMGLSILNKKLAQLQSLVKGQTSLVDHLDFSKKTKDYLEKFNKEVDQSFKDYNYDRKKLLMAKDTFAFYSESLRDDVEKFYGPKLTWLFDITFLASFTEHSMSSDYKNKLVLLQFGYLLDYIPYNLPTSVVSSVSNVVTVDDAKLTSIQVDLIREASQNILKYFSNPASYSPPATLTDLVGKWEGRLSTPDGVYHKAEIEINPDLSAVINVENIFKSMPVDAISLTQTVIGFDVKPYGEENLTIKFSGRIVDDVISGEAIDITGKKGLWQFMKVSQLPIEEIDIDEITSEPSSLDNLVGVWKGKILEENGAISNATLRFNLVDGPVLLVENANATNEILLSSVAANDKGVKFTVNPKGKENLNIIFLGKINGRILEGNAEDKNGSRGYWKLVKVSNEPEKQKLNYDYLNELCDPIVILPDESIIFVSNKKVIVPTGKISEGKYKGYMLFADGEKVEIIFDLNSKSTKMYLISKEDKSRVELTVSNLSITDRKIDFKTTIDGDPLTEVEFKGKVFADYIYGTAINASGQELDWELLSVKKTGNLLSNVTVLSPERVNGVWSGKIDFAGLMVQPVKMEISKDAKVFILPNNDKLNIDQLLLDANVLSFVAHDSQDDSKKFTFNGVLENDEIAGKLSTIDGLGLNVKLASSNLKTVETHKNEPKLEEVAQIEETVQIDEPAQDISEQNEPTPSNFIWKGDIGYGDSRVDMVLDFTKKDKVIYIDDFSTKSGRVKLLVSDLVKTPKVIKFKAKAPKDPTIVDFVATVDGNVYDGTAKNQLDGSKLLTWRVKRSEIEEYVPKKISHKKIRASHKFTFLDEVASVKQTNHVNKEKEAVKEDDKSEKVVKKEIKEKDKDDNKVNTKKEKKKDHKKKAKEASEEPQITDELMYKQSEIEKSKKQQEEHKKSVKVSKKDKDKDKDKNQKKEKKKKDKEKEKTSLESSKEIVSQDKTEPETMDKKIAIVDQSAKARPVEETKQLEQEVKFSDFKGKWIGEVQNPTQDKGEMILEIKKDTSYIHIDKEGEKVPFKLFDFSIKGNNIYFTLKPSPDVDYGIRFEGALIQGVLSGVAIGPDGKKGKWHAKRI